MYAAEWYFFLRMILCLLIHADASNQMTPQSTNASKDAPGGVKTDFANRLRAAFAHCLHVRLAVKMSNGGSNNTLYYNMLSALHPVTKDRQFASGVAVNKAERDAVQHRLLSDMTELRAAFVKQHGMNVDASAPVVAAAPRVFTQVSHLSAARQQAYNGQVGSLTRADCDQLLRSLLAQERADYEAVLASAKVRPLSDPLWSALDEFERWCLFRAPVTFNITCDPIVDFWALDVYGEQFPALRLCALMWFGLPGTSSTSERMASKATRIYTTGE
jgi:hypothetical protein